MGKEVIDFNADFKTTTNTGQAIVAIDPDAFGDIAQFKARVDKLVRELRASERMPGVDRVWLPGEQSHARKQVNEREGLALPPSLRAQLDAFAREIGIPLLQDH
jgi:L-2-hydroxycarboxylate dehydrogenase (NAD+)